jgi:sorbitol/mannitol transport system permease protein
MAASSMQPQQTNTKQRRGDYRKFLSAPGILFLVILTQVPFVAAIYYSFTNWNLLRPDSKGLLPVASLFRNFGRILTNEDFYTVLLNTVILTVSIVVITFLLGLGFALLLNRPFPGRSLARTLLISPFLMMPVAAAVLWKNVLLDPSFGISAYLLSLFGIKNFYLIEEFPMGSVIAIVSWQWIPFVMLILLAGLQSLPDSTVEAARIDGASGFNMFGYIILPHLRRFIEIALLLETIFILNEFGIIFVTTTGGPGIQTTNLPYQIFLEAFSRQNVGRASAYGIFAIVLANILVTIFLRIIRNQNQNEVPA